MTQDLRILFVNDEDSVLEALRASLRRYRKRWQMTFADGPTALALLEDEGFDVVVSESALTGVDGLGLLRHVALAHPQTVRIVLTSAAGRQGALAATRVAHQYLTMPCPPRELALRIERSTRLRSLLASPLLAELGPLDRLPSPPQVYWELQQTLARPDASVAEIAEIVEHDPAASAKCLQIANSAFFTRVRRVSTVRGAVSILGVDLLQALILQQGVIRAIDPQLPGLSLEREAEHGVRTALTARHLAVTRDEGAAFTAALLHDIGKLVLAERVGVAYGGILRRATDGSHLHRLERERLGVTHAEVGGYLLGVWGLADPLVEGVVWHHQPMEVAHVNLDVVAVVHAADCIVHGRPVEPGLSRQLGLAEDLPRWRRWYEEHLEAA